MRLLLDEQFTPQIAEQLSTQGYDATAVSGDLALKGLDDEILLRLATDQGRALMTNNVRHFAPLAIDWSARGDVHAGLIFTSDRSLPRTRGSIGIYVETLRVLFDAHPGSDALSGQMLWLR
ncbi:MAG: DUF5615 family PIN-like protein [Thermoleophilaceae bacterium]